MARIRSVKPEFWADEKLGPASPLTRLVYMGLWSIADDMGRMVDSVKQIDAFLFAYTDDTCREALDELAANGRIKRGKTASGQQIIQIINWNHQKIDHPNLKAALPAIAEDSPKQSGKRSRKIREGVAMGSREGHEALATLSVPAISTSDQRPVSGPPSGTGTDTGEQRPEPTSGAGPSVRLGVATARAKDNSPTAERCSCGGILPAHLGKCAVELAERMAQEAQHA